MALGCTAATALRDGAHGQVAAVFDSSLYLVTHGPRQYVCLLPETAADGPLHVRVNLPAAQVIRGFSVGDRWRVSNCTLRCGRRRINLAGASQYSPPRLPHWPGHTEALEQTPQMHQWRALAGHSAALAAVCGSSGAWPTFAIDALTALKAWLRAPASQPVHGAPALLGLGAGLTPAGDDLLGGLALMLRARHAPHLQPLIDALAPCLGHTHPVSAAHLYEALQGRASAPALDVLNGLIAQRRGDVEAACVRLGHSSGWDMLAGMLLAVITMR